MVVPRTCRAWLVCTILLIASIASPLGAAAETRVQTEIESIAAAWWTGSELAVMGTARGTVDFRSAPHQMVQSRLQLRLTLLDIAGAPLTIPEVPRAYVRFRFPVTDDYTVRFTTGRDRLSWGIGSLFNAGDLLFGSDGRSTADMIATDEVRDETAWLLAGYFPAGDLGYLETVLLPGLPGFDLAGLAENMPPVTGNQDSTPADDSSTGPPLPGNLGDGTTISDIRGGLRLHLTAGSLSIEPAYLYDGRSNHNRFALSLQGTALDADLYAAAGLDIPVNSPPPASELLRDFSRMSLGIFRSYTAGYDHTITSRLEALLLPGGSWEKQPYPHADYGLLLYPELTWAPGRTVTTLARAVVSPLDLSADFTVGASWNLFQGFTLLGYASLQAGAEDALYHPDRPQGMAAGAGVRYRF
ncbi:hypothetical protein [Spirochaeta africana]|uniref:Uncharacterized protein n=1 Tax=Spirochaeta africana (strain ATCC 700263 / DSM 8902 / Z-7692) TaxID=889378 RepID=H9UFI5_SPIAZ|nr:hypothetical protein [Spirochaeta africana]AFG36278.1 hypothetical protein Spiaf_0169 [Spirochaeta africana DSM 8902]